MQKLIYKKKTTFLPVIFFVFIFCQNIIGENDKYIPIKINGTSSVLFNQEYPEHSLNMYSIIYGNPIDPFPFNILSDFVIPYSDTLKFPENIINDSLFHFKASGLVGMESGNIMLKRYDGEKEEKRDLLRTCAAACSFPNIPANLYFGYRNNNNYSDSFDKAKRSFYRSKGQNMAFYKEELLKEFVAGYSLSKSLVTSGLKMAYTRQWGATPYFFSPVFIDGYSIQPWLAFKFHQGAMFVNFLYNSHKDYYNHIDYSEFNDVNLNIMWRYNLPKGIILKLSHHRNSELTPSSFTNVILHDTVPDLFTWTLSGKVFSNFRYSALVDLNYIQIPKFSLNINTAWDFIQKERDYTFYEKKTLIKYKNKMYEKASFHTSLNYTDTIFFPAEASIWLHYCEKPLWEAYEYTDYKTIISQTTIENAAKFTYGVKGSYRILFKKFSAILWGNMAITPKDKHLRFKLPMNLGTDLGYGRPDNDSLYAAVRFENRDGSSISYWKKGENKIATFTSPALTNMWLIFKLPFSLPFLRKNLRTNIQIDAGPIRLFSKEQRIKEHPQGSLIGPAVSLQLNCIFN